LQAATKTLGVSGDKLKKYKVCFDSSDSSVQLDRPVTKKQKADTQANPKV